MIVSYTIPVFMFVMGAIVGSFLNVCIVRLPKDQSIIQPRSHCIHCQHLIPWYDNVPLISYFILGGRCRFCKKIISWRYFVVELLTAMMFLVFYLTFGSTKLLLPYLVLISGFVVATFIDFEHRIIPDQISLGGIVIGLIFSLLIPELHDFALNDQHVYSPHLKSFWQSIMGVLIGGGSIYMMGLLGDFLFKKESMGGGDVKLLAMMGAFLGWQSALLIFFIAPFFGAVYGIIQKIRIKETTIAYGPFLVLAALITLFYKKDIMYWIMGGYPWR